MAKVKITLVKSGIDRHKQSEKNAACIGSYAKCTDSVEVEATPQIRGMIAKVKHLVDVKEI